MGHLAHVATLANCRPVFLARWDSAHAARWRGLAANSPVAAIGTRSAGARTGVALLTGALAASTADKYGRHWAEFESFCAANDWPALPTCPAAVLCFFATLVERRLAPASLQGYLTTIINRHADAGFPRPAAGALLKTLRAGYNQLLADAAAAFPAARAPLPAPLCWRITCLAAASADAAAAARFTAVVWQFVLAHRKAELLTLQLRDVTLPGAGGAVIQVRRFKGGERRTFPRRLVIHVPPAPPPVPVHLPVALLRRLVSRLRRDGAPPNRLLIFDPALDHDPTARDLTAWLYDALAQLGVSPPPRELYAS